MGAVQADRRRSAHRAGLNWIPAIVGQNLAEPGGREPAEYSTTGFVHCCEADDRF